MSARPEEPAVVFTVAPLTFQTYVSATASPSASLFVAVAVSVSFVPAGSGESETPAAGAEFWIVTAPEASGVESPSPSFATTETVIWSPSSPCPGWARSSVAPVAPAMSTPPRRHW